MMLEFLLLLGLAWWLVSLGVSLLWLLGLALLVMVGGWLLGRITSYNVCYTKLLRIHS